MKLNNILIKDNVLLLNFENGGYIRFNNLNCFDFQITKCDLDIDYLKFINFEDYRFLLASGGVAIFINIIKHEFYPDDDENWHSHLDSNIRNFLKDNFVVNNVEEYKREEKIARFRLRYVFDEIDAEEIESEGRENKEYIKNNINEILNNINNKFTKFEYNFLIAYLRGNYDLAIFNEHSLQIKPSLILKKNIKYYISNIILGIFEKYGLCVYDINHLQNYCPALKTQRLTFTVEVEQIGSLHNLRWEIKNLKY
jgi:hypothetical protein